MAKKAFGVSETGALTVDNMTALALTFIGDPDSSGFHDVDGAAGTLLLSVGSDSDDSDASDTTIDSDTTGGTDSDGTFISDNFSDSDALPNALGGLRNAINESPNWNAELVGGLRNTPLEGTILLDVTGDTEIQSGETVLIVFDTSSTDMSAGAELDFADGLDNTILRSLCIGPEADGSLGSDSYLGLARKSHANFKVEADPTDSDVSTTNSTVGPVYSPAYRAQVNRIEALVDDTDSTDAIPLTVLVFAAHQTKPDRLIMRHDPADAVGPLTALLDADDLAAVISDPETRIVVVAGSNSDADILELAIVGTYGNPDAYD